MKYFALVVVLTCAILCPDSGKAQGAKKRKSSISSGSGVINQWWIGVRGGVNASTANVSQSYHIFSYSGAVTAGDNTKKYESYSLPGLQFGFSVSYEFVRSLSINVLPMYASYRFEYGNAYRWTDPENPDKRVTNNYNFETRLQYVLLPMTIKYELTKSRLKPYVQVGAYYGLLTDAIKKVKLTSVDQASGADTEIKVTDLSVSIDDRTQKNNYGIIGGAGFTYNLGNARLGLELNYHYGLQNLDNPSMKYADNQLITGTYDVPDDYSLQNLEISFQVIMPMKFIGSKDYAPL